MSGLCSLRSSLKGTASPVGRLRGVLHDSSQKVLAKTPRPVNTLPSQVHVSGDAFNTAWCAQAARPRVVRLRANPKTGRLQKDDGGFAYRGPVYRI